MKKHILILLTAFCFIGLYIPTAFPPGKMTLSYSTIPDGDADYLISKRISEGDGLYSSFSILYPPGRFLIQGLLFHLIEPSFGWIFFVRILALAVLFPPALFALSVYIFQKLKLPFLISYSLGIASVLVYFSLVRSAQEIHVILALFFIVLLSGKELTKIRLTILGLLLGLIFLFRTESGILLSLSLIFSQSELLKRIKFLIAGFSMIWIPLLIVLLFHGSLINFLHDTLLLGLIIQPKFMSLPIPENHLWLVWFSTLVFTLSAAIAIGKVERKLAPFGLFAALSYVSALGRADEPHLWYGLVWLPIFIIFTVVQILYSLWKKEKISLLTLALFSLSCVSYAWLILKIKSPVFFLLTFPFIFFCLQKKKLSSFSILVGGCLSTLIIFHSVSYLKLIYARPPMPPTNTFQSDLWTSNEDEIGDYQLDKKSLAFVKQVRADIPEFEKEVFIFPKNLMLHEFLKLDSPTRYVILNNERSDWSEAEIISDLETHKTRYFLVFPDSAVPRGGPVWNWIELNTTVVREYQLEKEVAELRTRKEIDSCQPL